MDTDLLPLEVCSKPTLPVEQPGQLIIERYYPIKIQEKSYPERYDNSIFEKLNEMNADAELQNDYKKWKDGINFKTNRKIKIGGKIHRELKAKFMIYSRCSRGGILFDTLNRINTNEYLQETEKINNEIDVENAVIKDYNKLIDSIIEQIQKLEGWDEFIVFEGKKYGLIHPIKNNIHIDNNCLGELIFAHETTEYTFNDRPFCNYDDKETTFSIYKCSKCNYENKIIKCSGGGSQYVSKTGFWWK